MATDIVQSLFGVTPEAYQQAQQTKADAQALQYAQLSPFQQANYAIGRGASGLAGALGGALGGQDPQLKMIGVRQAVAKQINPGDPASVQQGIAALQQAGDAQGAFMLQEEYRKMQESGALVGQREASAKASLAQAGRDRLQGIPNDIQLAREISNLEEQVAQYTNLPPSPERDQALRRASGELAQLERLTTKEVKGPGFGIDREAVSAELYNKTFAQLNPTERAVINKRVEDEQGRKAKAGATTLVMPGDKALVDIPGFRASVQKTIEPQAKTVFAADNALTTIEDSIKTNNFASFRAAQVQFARAISGAGDLSQKELKAAGADPALLGGTADYLSNLFTSTPTLDTQNKIKSTLQAIKKVSIDKARAEIESQRSIARLNKGYEPTAIDTALNFPEFSAAPTAVTKARSSSDQSLLDKYAPKAK